MREHQPNRGKVEYTQPRYPFSLRAVLVVVTIVAVVLGVASWFPRQLASEGKPKAESRKPGQAESRKRRAGRDSYPTGGRGTGLAILSVVQLQ